MSSGFPTAPKFFDEAQFEVGRRRRSQLRKHEQQSEQTFLDRTQKEAQFVIARVVLKDASVQ